MKKKALLALGSLATTAFILTGCTDTGAPAPVPEASETGGGELQTVRVAALPITETGAIWAADEAGIFADHGLDIEVIPAQGGAQAIPALLSGDIDFAIGQPFGTFRADLQDLGVVMIGNYSPTFATGDDTSGVVALADSGIASPKDLAGKRVSVNSLGAAGDVTIMGAVEADGGDPFAVQFVEVAFPDAPAQLEAGNIDAAWVPNPFMSQVVNAGGVLVTHPFQDTIPGLTTLTTITTETLVEDDPELVDAFAEAMKEALTYANENPEALQEAVVTAMDLPAEAAANILFPVYSFELKRSDLEALAEMGVKYKVLPELPDFDRIVQQH